MAGPTNYLARNTKITAMNDLLRPLIDDKGYVLLDGALATELERRGEDLNDPLWSAKLLFEAPEKIEALHYDYFRAGADVATSASYQASFEGFAARGLDEAEARRLLRLSVELAQRARDRHGRGLVAASIGCYGAVLHDGSEYRGDYELDREELIRFHRPRMEALLSAEPDLLAFETVPCLLEAEAIVALLEEAPDTAAWITFSCRNETEVCHGESFADCVRLVSGLDKVVATGINCTAPQHVSGLLDSARGATEKLLAVYPNRGETWDAARHRWLPAEGSPPIVACAPEWYAAGARLIGGCCRTTPETIGAIALALEGQSPE